MVAQHGDGSLAQIAHETQGFQRTRPAIDQIADQPQPVDSGIEMTCFEQTQERAEAALDVANRVGGHGFPTQVNVVAIS